VCFLLCEARFRKSVLSFFANLAGSVPFHVLFPCVPSCALTLPLTRGIIFRQEGTPFKMLPPHAPLRSKPPPLASYSSPPLSPVRDSVDCPLWCVPPFSTPRPHTSSSHRLKVTRCKILVGLPRIHMSPLFILTQSLFFKLSWSFLTAVLSFPTTVKLLKMNSVLLCPSEFAGPPPPPLPAFFLFPSIKTRCPRLPFSLLSDVLPSYAPYFSAARFPTGPEKGGLVKSLVVSRGIAPSFYCSRV